MKQIEKVVLSKEEFASICHLAYKHAQEEGEDVIGVLMKNGAFWILNRDEDGLVYVAEKVEEGWKMYNKLVDEKIENARKRKI